MTRFRAPGGTINNLHTPPPAGALPDSVAKLLVEHERVKLEHERASGELYTLRAHAAEDEHAARQADAAAAAAASRSGKAATEGSHLDALLARRSRVEQETAALADAVSLILTDLWAAKDEAVASGKPAETVEKARARLGKAGADFAAALAGALQATATAEWLTGDAYDARPLLPIERLAAESANVVGPRVHDFPAIDVRGAIRAISSMVNP